MELTLRERALRSLGVFNLFETSKSECDLEKISLANGERYFHIVEYVGRRAQVLEIGEPHWEEKF